MKHRAEIDGLRAVAVIPVILFHAGFESFSGGFVGVDVFFVISGYLITTLLLEAHDEGRYSLIDFYARRARRILPALFVVLACSSVLAWLVMAPQQIEEFARTLLATALFASNVYFWKQAGYFAPDSAETPLLHTWSLAVEEQFYILFPLVLAVVVRFGRAAVAVALAAVAVASLGLAEWGSRTHPDGAFFLAPARAWELMAGALCAIVLRARGQLRNEPLAIGGLALILLSVVLINEETRFPSIFALAPVGGTALIILFAAPGTMTARLLSLRPFVVLGLTSYSAYLWHQPLLAFARVHNVYEPPPEARLLLAALSLVLGWLTWRFVETPFRRIRLTPVARRRLLAGSLAGVIAFAAVGGAGATASVFEPLWLASKSERTRTVVQLLRGTQIYDIYNLVDDGECRFSRSEFDESVAARLIACAERHGPGVVILGDSHGINVYQGVAQNSDRPFLFGMVSAEGCRPHAPRPQCGYYDAFRAFVHAHPEAIGEVIYGQGGYYLLQDRRGNPGRSDFFDMERVPFYRMSPVIVGLVHDYLADLARSVDVTWLGPQVEPRIAPRTLLRSGCEPGSLRMRPNVREIFETLDADLRALVEEAGPPRLRYVSQIDIMQFDLERDYGDCEQLNFYDENHWSRTGEVYFGARLAPALLPPS